MISLSTLSKKTQLAVQTRKDFSNLLEPYKLLRMAASLFSVSRLIGQARPGSNSNTSWLVADTTPEKDNQSQQSSLSVESENEMSKIDSQPEMRSSKTEETLEEADYNVLLPISAKASFGEWTDTGEKQCLATNWTPVVDISKKGETSPSTLPSIPDWTHLEFDGGMMSEDQLKRERATHAEEMLIMKEVKEKLGERVKELEEELHEAVSELHLKTEQITKFIIDHDEEEVEIKELKEENERIQEAAACERQKFLDERRSNEVTKELKDAMIVELLANQDGMQKRIDVVIGYLSESQARVAELESANEVQAKKLLEKEVLLSDTIAILERQNANLIDQVQELRFQARAAQLQPSGELAKVFRGKDAVLKGQKATLIAQVEELRAIAKVNERQNSVLLVQLGQKFEDVESNVATKAARRTIRPILIEQAVRTVKALNDHIYHFAASLTDCVDGIEKEFFEESDTSTLETLKSLLGRKIFTQLEEESRMMKDEYNRFILQTGFQTCLTASCMHIITLWDPAEPESGKILEIVYKKMRGEPFFSCSRPACVNEHDRGSRERNSMELHILDQDWEGHPIQFHQCQPLRSVGDSWMGKARGND